MGSPVWIVFLVHSSVKSIIEFFAYIVFFGSEILVLCLIVLISLLRMSLFPFISRVLAFTSWNLARIWVLKSVNSDIISGLASVGRLFSQELVTFSWFFIW